MTPLFSGFKILLSVALFYLGSNWKESTSNTQQTEHFHPSEQKCFPNSLQIFSETSSNLQDVMTGTRSTTSVVGLVTDTSRYYTVPALQMCICRYTVPPFPGFTDTVNNGKFTYSSRRLLRTYLPILLLLPAILLPENKSLVWPYYNNLIKPLLRSHALLRYSLF